MGANEAFGFSSLDCIINKWLEELSEFSIEALIILSPDPFSTEESRLVRAVQPVKFLVEAKSLSENCLSLNRVSSNQPLVGWQRISELDSGGIEAWTTQCLQHGLQSVFCIAFPIIDNRAFECYFFSTSAWHDQSAAVQLAWFAFNRWPELKNALIQEQSPLSPRETECLKLAFQGLTARESSEIMGCTERTVTFHVTNSLTKMKADNKLAAIQRACWFGLF